MTTRSTLLLLLILPAWMHAVACGGAPVRGDAARDAPADAGDAPVPPDAPVVGPDASASDGGSSGTVTGGPADIGEALNCGTPTRVHGTGVDGQLQLHAADTARFPDALCNDGTPAVLYYRPHRGDANRNRWVISLRGGGACSTGDNCASRWCACGNPGAPACPFGASSAVVFNLNNMSGGGSRSDDVGGVLRRDGPLPNPLQDYNHVEMVYCSSDVWVGGTRGVRYTTLHPRTGQPVTYTVHFLGARILDANFQVLRQDGVAPLMYTLAPTPAAMPDLDDAEQVVLVGDSAGGHGVIQNLDYLAAMLRAHHNGCDGSATCPPQVAGVIDAAVGPDLSRLDFTQTAGGPLGIDTYGAYEDRVAALAINTNRRSDESCLAWHRANRPGTEAQCGDDGHVLRNHVTTPFFVRQALLDSLISDDYETSRVADPVLGLFTRVGNVPMNFATVLRRELAAFPAATTDTARHEAIATAPGVFAPSCSNHDTIHEDSEVYGVTISPPGGGTYRFFDVFTAWRTGTAPNAVLSLDAMRRDTTCP